MRHLAVSSFFLIALGVACSPASPTGPTGGSGGSATGGTTGSGGQNGAGSGGSSSGGSSSGGASSGGSSSGGASSGGASSGGRNGSGGVGTGGGATGGSSSGGNGSGGSASGGTGGGGDGGAAAPSFVFASGNASTIRVYRLDPATGMLQALSMTSDGGQSPTYLALHPNKKFLYALNEAGSSSKIIAFSVGTDGALAKLATNGEATTAPGQGPPHLSVHPSGKWIFAAHYGSGHTTVHPITSNGGVGALVFNDKTCASEAHQAKVDPTGKFLLVPCRTPNTVAQYKIDEATGMLTANNPARVTAPTAGTGPRHMDFHPNGKWAYVLGELNGHVLTYAYDGATGLLSNPMEIPTKDGENAAAHIVVHPTGKFAFVSLRKSNEITTLTLDATTGQPTVTAHQTTMISTPRDFTLDPSGRFLLVANQNSGNVVVFGVDQTAGTLTMRSAMATAGISNPQCVVAATLP